MKSAYEIAMERLEKEHGPTRKLSDEQKAAIAEIDKKFDAKIAEQKLSYESRIAGADADAREKLRSELVEKLASLEAQREKEKESVWNSG